VDKTIDSKIAACFEKVKAIRIEEHKMGFPFMLYYESNLNLGYYEYADGHIEVRDGTTKKIIKIITGKIADTIRKKADLL